MADMTGKTENRQTGTAASALPQAWDTYMGALRQARELMEACDRIQRPQNRVDAYHALLELEAFAYNMLIAIRQNNPRVYTHSSWNVLNGIAQTSPSCVYSHLLLDGRQTYRLKLQPNDMKVVCMVLYNGVLGAAGTEQFGDVDFSKFEDDGDGAIEVMLSANEQPGNWIALDPNSRFCFCILRQFYSDWFDRMGEVTIEMLDPYLGPVELDEQGMCERILLAADFVLYMVNNWNIGLYDQYCQFAGGETNKLGYVSGEDLAAAGGTATTSYGLGVVDIEPDEAVIIESDPPDAAFWEFQIGNAWGHSLDFMHHQTDVNMARAVIDEDGKVRAVISAEDPGLKNWLDPLGRTQLCLVMRSYREIGKIDNPVVRVVKFNELSRHLPASTTMATRQQRQQDLGYRRKGFIRLFDTVAGGR